MVRWPLASVLSSFKCPLTGHISKSTFFPPEGNVTASFKGLPCGCGPWFPGTTSSQNPTHSPPRPPPFLGSLYALSHPFLKSPSCHGAPVCPWSHCGCWSLMLRVKGPVRSAKPGHRHGLPVAGRDLFFSSILIPACQTRETLPRLHPRVSIKQDACGDDPRRREMGEAFRM